MGPTGGSEDEVETGAREKSRISRRKFVAGGLLLVGGSSAFADPETSATFRDDESAIGDVAVASLNYAITDQSQKSSNRERYQISYQVLIDHGFDGVEIVVNNRSGGQETFTQEGKEGVVTSELEGNYGRDTYEFTFRVYAMGADGNSTVVFEETVTDVPDGTDPGSNDDLSSPDDPKLESFYVTDTSTGQDGVQYDIEYTVSNASDFNGSVRITLENADRSGDQQAYQQYTGLDPSGGSVSYSNKNRKNATFRITVEVVKDNGVVVSSGVIERENPDGTDSEWTR